MDYYKIYKTKNIFGLDKGERPFLYSFWLRKLLKLLPEGSKTLEVGCGYGYFLKWLEKKFSVVGIDISEDAIKEAKKRTKASLNIGDAEKLPFENSSFSAIVAFDLIEHLNNPEIFLSEVYRILHNYGLLILSTPNPESIGCKIKPKKIEWKGLPYESWLEEWHGWRIDTHINIRHMQKWRKLLYEKGFKILKDGTDTLWDIPYFKIVPLIFQKIFFISPHWILTWLFGFFPWKFGENYVCIAKKV